MWQRNFWRLSNCASTGELIGKKADEFFIDQAARVVSEGGGTILMERSWDFEAGFTGRGQ